jgi:hypothetical protein
LFRPGTPFRPGAAVRLIGAVCLVLLVVGCSRTRSTGSTALPLAPGPTFLNVVGDQARVSISAGRTCSTDDPVVLQCNVFPLFPAVLTSCPPPDWTRVAGQAVPAGAPQAVSKPGDRQEPASSEPCRPLGVEARWVGWSLTQGAGPSPTTTLRVYLGQDRMREVVEARDAGTPWIGVSVCPRDITRDGLTDLVVAFRTVQRPDVLDVEVVDLARSDLQVMVLSPQLAPVAEGQGCAAPPVRELSYNPGDHQLERGPDRRG